MTFMEGVRLGREMGSAPRRDSSGRRGSPPSPLHHGGPTPIRFGYLLDRKTGEVDIPLFYRDPLHIVLFGLNGAGKQTRFLTELYMTTALGRSLFIIETKGTAALQTAAERRKFSDTKIICPFPVLGLKSDGWNPLRSLDPKSPYFLGDARALARAMIDIETGAGQYWTESATGLVAALIMWEVIKASREGLVINGRRRGRTPSLLNVRMMLTEPDKWQEYSDAAGRKQRRLVAGFSLHAAAMIAEGGPIIKSLVGRFLRQNGRDELASIQSTAATQTEFLLNEFIAADLAKGVGVDLTQLSQRPMSIYCVCAASDLPEFRRWIRMMLSFAVRGHLERTPKLITTFVLDEYRATVGKLDVVKDNWALVREYGIQFLVCTQSALHLEELHGKSWEDFVGQAGCFATIGPPGDSFTAEFMSKRCGTTTVLRAGYNLADGVNSSDGSNNGTGISESRLSTNKGSARNYGRNLSGTFSVQQVERPAVMPQELFSMRKGEGRLWLQGDGTVSYPFFAPNYWDREAPWVARVKPNPYYKG